MNNPTITKYYSTVSGKAIHNVNNRMTREILLELGAITVYEMPPAVQDILSGASRQALTGTQPINRGHILQALFGLDDINTETVAASANRSRIALGYEPYSKRHIENLTAALRCASQGIYHHYNHHL